MKASQAIGLAFKAILLAAASPVIILLCLLAAAWDAIVSPRTERQLIEDGQVPQDRRYDTDFVARCRERLEENQ